MSRIKIKRMPSDQTKYIQYLTLNTQMNQQLNKLIFKAMRRNRKC